MSKLLDNINYPKDIKKLNITELNILCKEIRSFLIDNISKTGGHLASNLGVVELTVALHKIYDLPNDSIVWDVGHQSYVHKILTGRKERFNTLRQLNGLSGFANPNESKFDSFISGHSSTSISAALGIAKANSLKKSNAKSIAVIGDGALTGGMAYEALNNAGRSKNNIIIVLNDNEMSISKNVGAMAKYLSKLRSKPLYFNIKDFTYNFLKSIPLIGDKIIRTIILSKIALKELLYHSTMFEEMGFVYLGPIDGHDIKLICELLKRANFLKKPVLIHLNTVKGKGYTYAEQSPDNYHGITQFNIDTGETICQNSNCFTLEFGKELCLLAEKDEKVCAVTAAMSVGTGLIEFSNKFSDRFFDVGIAEQHAVTFCAGLAKNNFIPVFCVYSSFLQRAYDQIIHDVALQNLKVIFAIDRAGLVGQDGETHQGIFDCSFLNTIPNITILAPSNYFELKAMLRIALYEIDGPVAIRFPKGQEQTDKINNKLFNIDFSLYKNEKHSEFIAVSYGRIINNLLEAIDKLNKNNISVDVIKINKIKPINNEMINLLKNYKKVFIFEENIEDGSVGQSICSILSKYDTKCFHKGIKTFVPHGKVEELLKINELDSRSIADFITKEV